MHSVVVAHSQSVVGEGDTHIGIVWPCGQQCVLHSDDSAHVELGHD
jgi:hypothetical protein